MKDLRILVVYDSHTGNTEKLAREVAAGAGELAGTEVVLKKASATTLRDLQAASAILCGSPTYYGLLSAELKRLFDRSVKLHGKLAGKVGAAFTTSGGTATGAETTLLSILQALLVHGMIVQGRSDEKHYGAAAVGAPDRTAVKEARELGRRTAELALRLHASPARSR